MLSQTEYIARPNGEVAAVDELLRPDFPDVSLIFDRVPDDGAKAAPEFSLCRAGAVIPQ
jgi:hypothetical protein